MAFNFNFLFQPWRASAFAKAARDWYAALPPGAWPNFTLSNHDQPRLYSRFAPWANSLRNADSRSRQEADARARVAATMLLTLKGTPFLYYGEEIGMRNVPIPRKRLQDPLGRSTWPLKFGRDPERTPMQWDASENAGFTARDASTEPWLPVAPEYANVNVEAQRADPSSILSFYRDLLRLRHAEPALSGGEIEFLADGQNDCLAYARTAEARLVVALNFSRRARCAEASWPGGTVIFGTHRKSGEQIAPAGDQLRLAGYEVLIYRAESS